MENAALHLSAIAMEMPAYGNKPSFNHLRCSYMKLFNAIVFNNEFQTPKGGCLHSLK